MKVAVYVSPTIYNDSGLANAIEKYGKAVNQELGWSVHKEKLEEYKDWKKVRKRVMSDDYPVCIFVGYDIDYAHYARRDDTALIPFTSDVEPDITDDGRIKINVTRYKVDRAATVVYGTVDQIRDAFLKFSNRQVGGYGQVLFQPSDWEEVQSKKLSLLSLRGHASEYLVEVSEEPHFSVYTRMVKNEHIRILMVEGCHTTVLYPFPRKRDMNGYTMQLPDVWSDMVVINPYLHLVSTGGYGVSKSVFREDVIDNLLRGKTYAEAAMNKNIDMFYSMFGDPTFHLRPGSQEAPPSAPSPPPVTLPPKKSYIKFRSIPTGAELRLTKR